MTCWPGVRLWAMFSPRTRSRTASRKARTTESSTSASSNAARTSPRASSRSASESRPRDLSDVPSRSSRPLRESNMKKRLPSGAEQRIDEVRWLEGQQVLGALAHSHELDRDAEFALDRDHDAASRGAVQFGQHDARHVGCGEKLLGLAERILTSRGVE